MGSNEVLRRLFDILSSVSFLFLKNVKLGLL